MSDLKNTRANSFLVCSGTQDFHSGKVVASLQDCHLFGHACGTSFANLSTTGSLNIPLFFYRKHKKNVEREYNIFHHEVFGRTLLRLC